MDVFRKAYPLEKAKKIVSVRPVRTSSRVLRYLRQKLGPELETDNQLTRFIAAIIHSLEEADYYKTIRKPRMLPADVYYRQYQDEVWYIKFSIDEDELLIHTCTIDGDFH